MPSNSVPQNFGGMACPLSMGFGRAHGPQAVVAYMTVDGVVNANLGSLLWMQIGSAVFVGFLSNLKSDGDTTTLRAVDWRDRLHDQYYYAAFNMQESDGRFYHIPEFYWEAQLRVWISKELIQNDFDSVQLFANPFGPGDINLIINIAGQGLISALTLLKWWAAIWDFTFTAEQTALDILSRSYPLNLDWNGGVRRAEVIQQLLERCGCQFTCYGFRNLHVTIRGFTDNAFAQQFLQGFASYCTVGASEGSIGVEFNEKGRRVSVIGDRNKYEMVFPCIINWNPIWTVDLVFNGFILYALLEKHGLSRKSKLRELPEEYHDYETWDDSDFAGQGRLGERKTRNDMEIGDYVDKIPFHVYKVVNTLAARKFVSNSEDFTKAGGKCIFLEPDGRKPVRLANPGGGGAYSEFPLENLPLETGWDDNSVNSRWPISSKLVTDSNLQYMVYATSQHMIRGADFPFDEQRVFVPKDNGVSIAVEEMVSQANVTEASYLVRVVFSAAQVWIDKDKSIDKKNIVAGIHPDRVLVRMALDAEYFAQTFGEMHNGPRVREQKLSVRNLYQSFILNDDDANHPQFYFDKAGKFVQVGIGAVEEVAVLRQNFLKNMEEGGVIPVAYSIRAGNVAQGLAKQILNHPYSLRTGRLRFDGRAGVMVDGVIESTAITFDQENGIVENVNLTSERIDDQYINSPTVIRVSRVEKTEDDLEKDKQLAIDLAVIRSAKLAKKVMTVIDAGIRSITGLFKPAEVETVFGAAGKIEVAMPAAVVDDHDHKVGDVLIIGKPK